ncbi:hypothetical protein [Acetobacterium wieringae]|uniref:hypothetical protein n=1 Tax=Acetobacterium wieringae TaxID=52694 RepID=UPI0026F14251|nr:hypothetical protein [Acetobacterium wieringae]
MKEKMINIGLMIGYLLFFMLMDFWVIAIQNSFNTMEPLNYGLYLSRFWGMILIGFLKWFVLGFLLDFMSKNGKLQLKVDLIYLSIALIGAAIYFMMHLGILMPMPAIIYSEKFMTQLICLIPILSGFFMFESLFISRSSASTDQ